MIIETQRWFHRVAIAAALLTCLGCATKPPFFGGQVVQRTASQSTSSPPYVQDCAIVTIGSPTKYACNGKVYTSFELAKLHVDWTKSHGG